MLAIRPFEKSDVVAAHRLSGTLNWPHRLADWRMMAELGRGYVACYGTHLTGTALWWPFGADHGSVGMVIVEPSAQGQGIGRMMMNRILADAGSRTLNLNSTESGRKLYQQLGFEPVGTVRKFEGNPVSAVSCLKSLELRPATSTDLAALCAIEREAMGFDRVQLLECLLRDGNGVIAMNAGSIMGYAFRRKFGRGELIGPVVASSEGMAKSIIAALLAAATAFVRIDCDGSQNSLMSWLVEQELVDCGPVTRMVRGLASQKISIARQFAVASQALG